MDGHPIPHDYMDVLASSEKGKGDCLCFPIHLIKKVAFSECSLIYCATDLSNCGIK